MFIKIKTTIYISVFTLIVGMSGCKKITPDLNVNPNVPSVVDPKYLLSGSLTKSAALVVGNPGGGSQSGNDLIDIWMGYWTVSGDYIPSAPLLQYTLTNAFGSSIWNNTYLNLIDYKKILDFYGTSASTSGARYTAMARIMMAFHYQRLVDMYNNIPYSQALNGGPNNYPTYDNADSVYQKLVTELTSCVALINTAATATADNPGGYDIMYGGDMTKWKAFANTTKLKLLVHLSHLPTRAGYITANLAGMTTADFIGANADATIQPGYTNAAGNQQNPLWNDVGFTTSGALNGDGTYFRANIYGVNFYKNNNDPRLIDFYTPATATGTVVGRVFGSTNGQETNSKISGLGGNANGATQTFGTCKSATQGSVILSSSESLFLQTEAQERGFLPGGSAGANASFQSAVTESFRYLGVPSFAAAAATYISQANNNTNLVASNNRIRTIILQKWAAMNTINPLESWTDWRRLNIPSDIPLSTYPGVTAPHIPYRLIYPTSEYDSNPTNVNAQGAIDPINNKIFWMP